MSYSRNFTLKSVGLHPCIVFHGVNVYKYMISGAHEEKEPISHIHVYTMVILKNKVTLADSHSC